MKYPKLKIAQIGEQPKSENNQTLVNRPDYSNKQTWKMIQHWQVDQILQTSHNCKNTLTVQLSEPEKLPHSENSQKPDNCATISIRPKLENGSYPKLLNSSKLNNTWPKTLEQLKNLKLPKTIKQFKSWNVTKIVRRIQSSNKHWQCVPLTFEVMKMNWSQYDQPVTNQ